MPRKHSAPDVDALIAALPASLAGLAARAVVHPYRKGAVLIEEGQRGDTLYIVLSGRLRAFSTNLSQSKEITYGTYGSGEYVGEMSLDGGPRAASVMATEPSLCAIVTRSTVQAYIADHPAFAFELLAKVIGRARAATLSARQLALNDVYGRIKSLLESLAGAPAVPGWAALERISQREMAARVGCSHEMVCRVMRDLETGGHVEVGTGGLRVRLPLPARW
ncbi:MAG: Crp/Fnr family transcriptional regulator [Rubrivivax sp.]|nr:Crp/Fnr family transcriptional regulator [Rubrivivax sp.]